MTTEGAESHHRRQLFCLYQDVLKGGKSEALAEFFTPDYRPHVPPHRGMPALAPGLEPLRQKLASTGRLAIRTSRIVCDGAYAYMQVLYETEPAVSGVDIFRFDSGGKIADHWNVRQPLAGESPEIMAHRFSGPGSPDAEVPTDAPARNKRRARDLYEEVWSKGNADLALDYYTSTYIQHNPHIQSGSERIRTMIATDIRKYMAHHQSDFPIELRHIGAEGDLVFVHFDIWMAGLGRNDGDRSTIVDIFRVDGDGRFAEHWDVCHMESDRLPDHATLF